MLLIAQKKQKFGSTFWYYYYTTPLSYRKAAEWQSCRHMEEYNRVCILDAMDTSAPRDCWSEQDPEHGQPHARPQGTDSYLKTAFSQLLNGFILIHLCILGKLLEM